MRYKQAAKEKEKNNSRKPCTDWPRWARDRLRATVNNAQKCNLIISQFLTFYQSHTMALMLAAARQQRNRSLCPLLLEEDHY